MRITQTGYRANKMRGGWHTSFAITVDPRPETTARQLKADLEEAGTLQRFELCWFGRRVRILHGAAPLAGTAQDIEEQGKHPELAKLIRAIRR